MQEYKAGPIRRKPTHPGQIIKTSLRSLRLSQAAAAKLLGVETIELRDVIRGKSSISLEMALRLDKFFGTGPDIWIDMQVDHDLWVTKERLGRKLSRIKSYKSMPRVSR